MIQSPLGTLCLAKPDSIIAISGLASHAFGSWAHSDECMWLRDYLPRYVDNARIMIYGYTSELQHTSSFSVLQDYSRTFLHKLVDMREYAKVTWLYLEIPGNFTDTAQCEDRSENHSEARRE